MLEVVTLTAPSGGREEVLGRMERAILAGEEGSLLYLCATRPLLEDTRRKLLGRAELPGLGRLRLVLFQGLVDLILRQSMEAVAPLDPAVRDLLLSQVIRRLAAEGRLSHLAPIAETRGLGRSVAGLLAELKRANIRPVAWRQVAAARRKAKWLDLAEVYEAYQAALENLQAVDPDDMGLWALDALVRTDGAFFRGDPAAGQPAIREILVDGYQDFTPVQLAWLKVATVFVPRVTVYLEYDPDRPELYGPSSGTMTALEDLAGDRLLMRAAEAPAALDEEEALSPSPPAPAQEAQALRLLAEELFRPRRQGAESVVETPGRGTADGETSSAAVQVLAAQGDASEARELARWVRQALLADPGLSPGGVAIVYRELGPEAELLAKELEQAGVPCSLARSVPVSSVPAARAALSLLRAAVSPDRMENLIAAVTCGYLDLPGMTGFEEVARELGATVPTREWLTRLEVRVAYLRRAMAAEGEAPSWQLARDVRRYAAARRAAGSLLKRLGRWPAVFSPEEARDLTARLLESFKLRQAVLSPLQSKELGPDEAAELVARDLAALDKLAESATALGQVLEASGTVSLKPGEWLAALEQSLSVQELRLPGQIQRSRAAVQILPAPATRRLRFRLVAMAGLTEGRFPKRFQPDWLLTDEERESLRRHGVTLDTRRELSALERLYFYQAATSASERLLLSYPAAADDGKEQLPSPYLQEVLALFPSGAVPVWGPRPGQLWPDTWREAATPDELKQMAVFRALHAQPFQPQPAPSQGGGTAEAAALLARLQRGGILAPSLWPRLAAEAERQSPIWGPHDGRITRPVVQQALGQRYSPDYSFSASQLGRYSTCPFSFFAERVLRLAPLDEGGEEVDALQVGSLYHQILYAFWDRHRGEPVGAARRDEYRADLRQVAQVELSAFEAQGLAAHPGLWAAKRRQIEDRLLGLLERELDLASKDGPVPTLLEVGFGMPGLDPASRSDPVRIGDEVGGFLLKGKIDRIDRTPGGGFLVLDYKTGTPPRSKDIETGRDLQVPLYLEAARVLLGSGSEPLGGGYESIKDRTRNQGLWKKSHGRLTGVGPRAAGALDDEEWGERVAASVAYAGLAVAGIRGGDFRLDPNGECPKACPYQRICRVNDHRLAGKRRQIRADPQGGDLVGE